MLLLLSSGVGLSTEKLGKEDVPAWALGPIGKGAPVPTLEVPTAPKELTPPAEPTHPAESTPSAESTSEPDFDDTPISFQKMVASGLRRKVDKRVSDFIVSGAALSAVPSCKAALALRPMNATCRRPGPNVNRMHSVYSKQGGLAYFKTAKAGSVSFQNFMVQHFDDSHCTVTKHCSGTSLPAGDLPPSSKVFGFTFVRDPLARAIAGYAEVDAVHGRFKWTHEGKKQMKAAGTTYVNIPHKHGAKRFMAYLDDMAHGRLPQAWKPSHSCPQADPLESDEYAVRYGFIGRLETLSEDWNLMQQLAGVPLEQRTTAAEAVPKDHQGNNQEYLEDERITRTDELVRKVCELYAADYACFGYQLPEPCRQEQEEQEEEEPALYEREDLTNFKKPGKKNNKKAGKAAHGETEKKARKKLVGLSTSR